MEKEQDLIIVSNRLPVSIKKIDGKIKISPSSGGLATAVDSLNIDVSHRKWIGWPGIESEELEPKDKQYIRRELKKIGCYPVFLTKEQVDKFYSGYANDTLWPAFHYFQAYTQHSSDFWGSYNSVNELFAKQILKYANANSKIWVHDYHLMLLPSMLREAIPDGTIGFFLHIPFPSYEIFRSLPNREEILRGLLGSDLVGFHIYDYARHYLDSNLRLLGLESDHGSVFDDGRQVRADSFPIGIDYEKFKKAAIENSKTEFGQNLKKEYKGQKIILSVDRLDYSKGILKRLEAFEKFLEENKKYHKKVNMIVVAVPSRTDVETYKKLREEIEIAISRINGKYSELHWTPITYQFKNLPFEELTALYAISDIALVTPIRDGMNLVAKEFVACKYKQNGALILSEMTGASDELHEALMINPNDIDSIASSIKRALSMPVREQKRRISAMQSRISAYNVQTWAKDFMEQLDRVKGYQVKSGKKLLTKVKLEFMQNNYQKSKKRAIFLDYDGTLRSFVGDFSASKASPTKKLIKILKELTKDKKNDVFIISGRPHEVLDKWFSDIKISLVAEHGAWVKDNGHWTKNFESDATFKENVLPILKKYTERTPGSKTEEKTSALVWHYRNVSPELAYTRRSSIQRAVQAIINKDEIEVHLGNKILEIKSKNINKGNIIKREIADKNYDFYLCIGDDYTDEDMFEALPTDANTIKVGLTETKANYQVKFVKDVHKLLCHLTV